MFAKRHIRNVTELTLDFRTGWLYEGPPSGHQVLCMPMKINIPEGKPGWKDAVCPVCGRECWDKPIPEGYKALSRMCTECCIRVVIRQ
jgi:hypothetical protein